MSEPVRIVVPQSVTPYLKPDSPLELRLKGAGGDPSLPAREELMLLFCLSKDKDTHVREAAVSSLSYLNYERIACIDGWEDLHPAVIHSVAVTQGHKPMVKDLLLKHPAINGSTRELLLSMQPDTSPITESGDIAANPDAAVVQNDDNDCPPVEEPSDMPEASQSPDGPEDEEGQEEEKEKEEEEEEEYYSKYQLAQVMGIGEKIKMALTGDKEWRKILIKDSNKLVSSGVLKNPRITEPEVLNVLKSGTVNDEIMRLICANKEWVKNYPIRKALVEHPKTPLANALRFLSTLNDKDVANYAKSRNISSVISTQAKRTIMSKQNKR